MPTVNEILEQRQYLSSYWSEFHSRADDLIGVYHGNFQKLYPDEFRRGEEPKIANWIKLGWDRYATMIGKVPVSHVPASRLRRVSQHRADQIEKVLSHYDYSSGMAHLAKWYAWYLVGLGASCIGVMPDPALRGPRYFVKDPRTVLPSPGAGSVPTTSSSYGFLSAPDMTAQSLHMVIISETVTPHYLLDHYRTEADRMKGMFDGDTVNTPQDLLTYMDRDVWTVLLNRKKFMEVDHGLGFVPVRFTTMHVPDQLGGQSAFEQNIGLVLAYIRTMNQKLTYNQNLVWPWLVLRGLNEVDYNSRVIELLDREGGAEFLHPPAELQAERDLDMLDRVIRVMNRDTESMQGEAPGSVVTGTGVRELNRDVKNQVLNYWDIMAPDYEFVRSAALALDESLYGGVKKPMFGRVRGENFEEEYVPREIIKGNHHVVVDFGIGVGGMEGFVELMQTAAQGYIDEQSVMENLPWIRSTSETRRKVLLDRLEKILFGLLAEGAPSEIINHLSAWRVAIENGQDPWKWIMDNPMPVPGEVAPEEAGGEAMEGGPLPPVGQTPPGAAPGLPAGMMQAMAAAQQGAGQAPAVPGVRPGQPTPAQLMALLQQRGR